MVEVASPTQAYTAFVEEVGQRFRLALFAAFGPDTGANATAESLAYGWEHWDRLRTMENPAGYLYKVGGSKARGTFRRCPYVAPVTALVEAGPGLVAVGTKDDGARIWVSPDGVDWTLVSDGQGGFGPNSWISDVTVWDGGLVAVGSANEKAAVWTSTDGSNWTLALGG